MSPTERLSKSLFRERLPIAHPEWLKDGLESATRTFRLAKEEKIPDSILGFMLVTSCMRVLRSVYGDDLTTVCELRRKVLNDEQLRLERPEDLLRFADDPDAFFGAQPGGAK